MLEIPQGEIRRIAAAIDIEGGFPPLRLPDFLGFMRSLSSRSKEDEPGQHRGMHIPKSVAGLISRLHRPLR